MFDRGFVIVMGNQEKYWIGKVFSKHIPCGFYDFSHVPSQPFQSLPFNTAIHYSDKYAYLAKFNPTWVRIMPCDVILNPEICKGIVANAIPR